MKYLGGKFRTAGDIAGYINSVIGNDQPYWEPFVGAAWVLRRVSSQKRYASDINHYLISMWLAVQNGWVPPSVVTNEEYNEIKGNIDQYPPELVSFVGFATSWGGKWFGGYARDPNSDRNYAKEGMLSLLRAAPLVRSVEFFTANFLVAPPPEESMLIYCDPPYMDTTKYNFAPQFNHDRFWNRVRELEGMGHNVIVSEYSAPDDFQVVLEMQTRTDLNVAGGIKDDRIERVFSLSPLDEKIKQLKMF